MKRTYRALIVRAANPPGGSVLHLVRDGAEASLCGLPLATLGTGESEGGRVCPECIDWLPKRMAVTGVFERPPKP